MDFTVLQQYAALAAQGFMALIILATIVVRLTPTKSDDAKLLKFYESVHKLLAFLPTFGVNPRTQQLESWYEENKPKTPTEPPKA